MKPLMSCGTRSCPNLRLTDIKWCKNSNNLVDETYTSIESGKVWTHLNKIHKIWMRIDRDMMKKSWCCWLLTENSKIFDTVWRYKGEKVVFRTRVCIAGQKWCMHFFPSLSSISSIIFFVSSPWTIFDFSVFNATGDTTCGICPGCFVRVLNNMILGTKTKSNWSKKSYYKINLQKEDLFNWSMHKRDPFQRDWICAGTIR